jgi:hypothetical protein
MKPQIFLFALLSFPLTVGAQETVVAPIEGRDLRFDLPRSGDVFARDVRSVTLPAGRAKLQIEGLRALQGDGAGNITLRLDEPAKVLQNLAPSVPAKGYSISNFIGQRVSLVQSSADDPTKSKTISGILRYSDSRYSLETGEGTLFGPMGTWLLPNLSGKESGISDDPQWLVEGAGKTRVESSYRLPNLAWSPRYVGFLSTDRKSVELQGWVDMSAPDNFDWRGANFTFTDGDGSFKLPADILPRGGKSSLAFWNAKFSVVQSLSFFNGEWMKTMSSFQPTLRTYKTVENGGAFLPRGPLTIWQQIENGTARPSNFESFGATTATTPLILPLSDSTTAATVKRVVTSNKLLNPQTREVIITWQYRGQVNGATLSITEILPADASIKESSLKPVENDGRQLRFEVNGESAEFTYRFQLPA